VRPPGTGTLPSAPGYNGLTHLVLAARIQPLAVSNGFVHQQRRDPIGPVGHTLVSSAVGGGVWLATGSPAAAVVTVGVGVMMDIDHLYDYYHWLIKRKPRRIYVLLHAWEYSFLGLVALALLGRDPLLMAVVLGHLAHVASDHLYNGMPRFSYFISYRIAKGFVIPPRHRHGHGHADTPRQEHLDISRLVPFGQFFAPWLDRRFGPWIRDRIPQEGSHTHHG